MESFYTYQSWHFITFLFPSHTPEVWAQWEQKQNLALPMSFTGRNTWGQRKVVCTIWITKNPHKLCSCRPWKAGRQGAETQGNGTDSVSWGHRTAAKSQGPGFGVLTQHARTLSIWKPALGSRQRLIKPQMNKGFCLHMQPANGQKLSSAAATTVMRSSLLEKKQEDLIGHLCYHLVYRLFF